MLVIPERLTRSRWSLVILSWEALYDTKFSTFMNGIDSHSRWYCSMIALQYFFAGCWLACFSAAARSAPLLLPLLLVVGLRAAVLLPLWPLLSSSSGRTHRAAAQQRGQQRRCQQHAASRRASRSSSYKAPYSIMEQQLVRALMDNNNNQLSGLQLPLIRLLNWCVHMAKWTQQSQFNKGNVASSRTLSLHRC